MQCGIGGERSRCPRVGGRSGRRGLFRLGDARGREVTIRLGGVDLAGRRTRARERVLGDV